MATEKQPMDQISVVRPRIRIGKNGPYYVSGGAPLEEQTICSDADAYAYKWQAGKKYPLLQNYRLCRCGQSKTKPFCNDMHLRIRFDGTETATREPYLSRVSLFDGPTLDLTDVIDLCADAGFCTRAGGTWELTRQSSDPRAREMAIEETWNCPSGRLVVWDKEGKVIEPDLEPSLVLVHHDRQGVSGPIWVRDGIQVESADGTIYETRNRVTLCRCGRSSNKPFCDGSHLNI